MPARPFRAEQVGELIRKELAGMLLREIDFPPGTLVTVTRVVVTRDMREARAFVSVLPFARRFVALEKLKAQVYHIQGQLNGMLQMRFAPRISFVLDKTEEEASKVEEMLDKVSKEK